MQKEVCTPTFKILSMYSVFVTSVVCKLRCNHNNALRRKRMIGLMLATAKGHCTQTSLEIDLIGASTASATAVLAPRLL